MFDNFKNLCLCKVPVFQQVSGVSFQQTVATYVDFLI